MSTPRQLVGLHAATTVDASPGNPLPFPLQLEHRYPRNVVLASWPSEGQALGK